MANSSYTARFQHKRDSASNFTKNNPTLLDGEIVVVDTGSGTARLKVGKGSLKFNDLPYIDEALYNKISDSINAIPYASSTVKGMLKIGAGLSINGDGVVSVNEASDTKKGIVQLSDSTNSNSSTTAASSRAVKTLNDANTLLIDSKMPKSGGTFTGSINMNSNTIDSVVSIGFRPSATDSNGTSITIFPYFVDPVEDPGAKCAMIGLSDDQSIGSVFYNIYTPSIQQTDLPKFDRQLCAANIRYVDSKIHVGSTEPTDEGTVIWIDPNGDSSNSITLLPISRGGTGATTATQALLNLGGFSSRGGTIDGSVKFNSNLLLSSESYGASLPSAGIPGRIFFKKV